MRGLLLQLYWNLLSLPTPTWQGDEIEDRFLDAIEDYRQPDHPDYKEDVNDALEYIQEEVGYERPGLRPMTALSGQGLVIQKLFNLFLYIHAIVDSP